MPTVSLKSIQLASSTSTIPIEGNPYFPPSSLNMDYFKPSSANTHTTCGWKGVAHYYDVHLQDGTIVKDAAWYYPDAKSGAKNIQGYVAFYKSKVQVA